MSKFHVNAHGIYISREVQSDGHALDIRSLEYDGVSDVLEKLPFEASTWLFFFSSVAAPMSCGTLFTLYTLISY